MTRDKIGDVFLDEIKNNIYNNRTRKYLTPILKNYGKEFVNKLNITHKIAIGVSDTILLKSSINYDNHLFILFDTKKRTKVFEAFLEYAREFEYYSEDYIFGNMQKSSFHIIIFRVPEKFKGILEIFKQGKYSKLYNKEDINLYFPTNSDVFKILSRNITALPLLVEVINKEFDVSFTGSEFKDIHLMEFDIPPTMKEETFNNHLK